MYYYYGVFLPANKIPAFQGYLCLNLNLKGFMSTYNETFVKSLQYSKGQELLEKISRISKYFWLVETEVFDECHALTTQLDISQWFFLNLKW